MNARKQANQEINKDMENLHAMALLQGDTFSEEEVKAVQTPEETGEHDKPIHTHVI